mmetsp:Transcript_12654/g.17668  ORF Transcript_12654/g.17668 Transcript_12654/m.17668 type:complete len:94 (+) Transcript_12654:745-1026(+)
MNHNKRKENLIPMHKLKLERREDLLSTPKMFRKRRMQSKNTFTRTILTDEWSYILWNAQHNMIKCFIKITAKLFSKCIQSCVCYMALVSPTTS